jgi:hypothetical protein
LRAKSGFVTGLSRGGGSILSCRIARDRAEIRGLPRLSLGKTRRFSRRPC